MSNINAEYLFKISFDKCFVLVLIHIYRFVFLWTKKTSKAHLIDSMSMLFQAFGSVDIVCLLLIQLLFHFIIIIDMILIFLSLSVSNSLSFSLSLEIINRKMCFISEMISIQSVLLSYTPQKKSYGVNQFEWWLK